MTMDEALARAEAHYGELADLEAITYELLLNCMRRKQLGPVDLAGLPSAPTVIDQTLWLPWLSGSGTWMISGLFGSGQGGNYSPQGGGGD